MTMTLFLLIVLYATCIYAGGAIMYMFISGWPDFSILHLTPVFAILSLIIFFVPVNFALFGIKKQFRGLAYWAMLIFLTWSVLYGYNFLMNRSKVLLFADFYWDAGIDLYLRENGTYKAIERGWIHDELKYGKYRLEGNHVILSGALYIGISRMNDTLVYDSAGLHFKLDSQWKSINGGTMTVQVNEFFD